ncbi:MAG: glycerophosphodiester phosphodiesterase [Actinomycetota bacterium]|nr:glycerophosphodiester phosphodiesterase [Actinomycetota bacterium]
MESICQITFQNMIQVCAHRGVSSDHRENTLEAFHAAVQQEADSIELDVWLTKDNQLAIHHDKTCEGIDIEGSTLERLPNFVTTLNDVLNNFKTIPLNIELKISPFTDLERLAKRVVYEFNGKITSSPLLVSSFNLEILQNLRKYSRRIRLGYLTAQEDWERSKLFETVTENNFQAVHPHYSLVSEDFMNISKENDVEVNVWTVNEQSAVARQVNLGVNSIITDEVQMVKAFIEDSTS